MVSFNNINKAITCVILFFLLTVTMKSLMNDSPPNPEDGELWIPSDVFNEIVSSKSNIVRPQNVLHQNLHVSNGGLNNFDQPKKSFTRSPPLPKPIPKLPKPQILDVYKCGIAGGTFRQNNGKFGIGIPNTYYPRNNNYKNVTFYVQQVARPIHIYNPMFQPNITPATQVINSDQEERANNFNGDPINSGGTGFFLPHPSTGVKNKKHNVKAKVASGVHLPKDWTY